MFVTYLDYLDSIGIREPWRYVVVIGNEWWANEVMKTTPFTPAEVERIKTWGATRGIFLLFDPYRKEALVPSMKPMEAVYSNLGFLGARERKVELAKYSRDFGPVSDDKPFFYKLDKDEDFLVSSLFFSTPLSFVCIVLLASVFLFSLPLRRIKKGEQSAIMLTYAGCFAAAGFAFLLSEAAVIQMFSVF